MTSDRADDVAILTLDRPPANAITYELARAMGEALDEAEARDPRALVLTGRGSFFSGGLDLRVVPGYDPERQGQLVDVINRLVGRLYAQQRPVVAAVNGHAVAGGLVLVLTADYRVGPAGEARFGLPEARAGIPFPGAPAVVARAELAPADLRFMTLAARNFGPEEARRRGVLDELRPAAEVLSRAIEVARDLASMPADAYARVKQQFRADAIAAIARLNEQGSDPMLRSWISDRATEAGDEILADGG